MIPRLKAPFSRLGLLPPRCRRRKYRPLRSTIALATRLFVLFRKDLQENILFLRIGAIPSEMDRPAPFGQEEGLPCTSLTSS